MPTEYGTTMRTVRAGNAAAPSALRGATAQAAIAASRRRRVDMGFHGVEPPHARCAEAAVRRAKSAAWSSPIFPTAKYIASGCAR